MDKFNILLVEDNERESNEMIAEIKKSEIFVLAKRTNSCIEAYDYIVNQYPDAVILDLEMKEGYGDGMILLANLYNANLNNKPFIVVTTNNESDATLNRTKQLGAGYSFCKHKPDYTPAMVLEYLKIQLLYKDEERTKEFAKLREQRLKHRLFEIFNKLNMPFGIGRDYLVQAIALCLNGTKEYVKFLELTTGKKPDTIRGSMDYAIKIAWDNSDYADLGKYYTGPVPKSGSPTHSSFVFYYTHILENEFKV